MTIECKARLPQPGASPVARPTVFDRIQPDILARPFAVQSLIRRNQQFKSVHCRITNCLDGVRFDAISLQQSGCRNVGRVTTEYGFGVILEPGGPVPII